MSPEVPFVASKTSKEDGSSEEPAVNPTSEIVDFLIEQLHSKRKPIEQAVFDRDPQMYRRVGQYEKALTAFLADEPHILSIGDDSRKREIWLEVISQSYQQEIDHLDQQDLDLQIQREEATGNLHNLSTRIVGIGRDRFAVGDLGLLLGRVQVELYDLKQKGRLNILGRLAERLIGSRQIHPQVEPIQKQLTAADEEIKKLEEERHSLAAEHFKKENEQRHHLETGREKLLHELDVWAVGSSERFLVHYLYYQRPDLEKYLRSHSLTEAEQRSILILEQNGVKNANLTQPEDGLRVKVFEEVSSQLPIAIIVGGEIITDRKLAEIKIGRLKKNLPKEMKRQIFRKLVQALKYESQGLHHPDSTVITHQDMIDRIGGNWRLHVAGNHRLIGNLNSLATPQDRMPEIVRLLHRNDPNYY